MELVFSTREGGVSHGHLSSLNLGWDRGEPRENVVENYKRVCRVLGVDYRHIVLSDQIHETTIVYADSRLWCGEHFEKKVSGVDGLYTDVGNVILATSYADCVPLFFYAPGKHMIASVHSGWRGTVSKIGAKAVALLVEQGCQVEDIHVVIGPSICQQCYEVSFDVAERFKKNFSHEEMQQIIKPGRLMGDGEQKYQLDLWAANWLQLKEVGVCPENIHLSGVCTCCNSRLLFSHRATEGKRGNLNGFMRILT
jgi:hypothetical protein